jgi:predicted small metal-binding protein
MRQALDCFCGQYLEGDDEKELLNWTRAHVERQHQDMQLTEEQVRQMVAEGAYDTQGKAYEK